MKEYFDKWTGKPLDSVLDSLEEWNGENCDHCGGPCIDRCMRCGAPQCCPRCCKEAFAQADNTPLKEHP